MPWARLALARSPGCFGPVVEHAESTVLSEFSEAKRPGHAPCPPKCLQTAQWPPSTLMTNRWIRPSSHRDILKMLMNAHQSLKIVVTEALSEPMLTAIPAFAEAASCPDGEAVTAQEVSQRTPQPG